MKKDSFLIFSERLKYLRENNCLTQKDLSNKLKERGFYITEDMISTFERGITEPKFSQIHAICEVLEVTPDFLFGYVQIPLKINNKNRNPDFYYLLKNYLNKENMTEESIYELLEIIKTLVKGILSKK